MGTWRMTCPEHEQSQIFHFETWKEFDTTFSKFLQFSLNQGFSNIRESLDAGFISLLQSPKMNDCGHSFLLSLLLKRQMLAVDDVLQTGFGGS